MPTWGGKKQNTFLRTQKTSRCVQEKKEKKQKASENHDLFSKSDANRQKQLASKEPPMRD